MQIKDYTIFGESGDLIHSLANQAIKMAKTNEHHITVVHKKVTVDVTKHMSIDDVVELWSNTPPPQ